MTKIEFRRLFSDDEQKRIDRFNATFENSLDLTEEQKDDIRTGLKTHAEATEVLLSDSSTQAAVGLYEALGLIAPGRAAEIIAEPIVAVVERPVFVATHTVQDFGLAMVEDDGAVRLADGRWTTLEALATMNKTVEVL